MKVKNFKYTRERKNIKQKEIAEILGVHFSTVSGWESGKDTIPLKYLIKYANHYNYSLDYLFGITKENKEYEELEIDLNLIAKNLKILRKIHGDTQKDLSKKLNYSISGISHYETGRTLMPTIFIYALTKEYQNFSIDKLLGRKVKEKTTVVA